MALLLLPIVWVPGHSHSIEATRANCSACLLTVLSTTILSVGVTAILLVRERRLLSEFAPQLAMLPSPCPLGRAPPRPFDR